MEGTKFVPPIVSCSPPPLAPLSPPPMPDSSDGPPLDIGGFSLNSFKQVEVGIGESDFIDDAIEELDYDGTNGLDDDEYDVTGKIKRQFCNQVGMI